jgi:E3 ubiquitin-protein ligase DOA10
MVHDKCLQRWITTSGRSECSVCLTEFRNVTREQVSTYTLDSVVMVKSIIFFFCCVVFIVLAIEDPDHASSYIIFSACFLMSVILVFIIGIKKETGPVVSVVRPQSAQ